MRRKAIVAVVGTGSEHLTGSDDPKALSDARELGEALADEEWVIVTGGRDAGVMRAVNDGAKKSGRGITIGLLPGHDDKVAESVDIALHTDLQNARNNLVVLSASVVIACGVDGPGTASELALALKNKKPVILLNTDATAVVFFKKIGGERVYTAASVAEVMRTIRDHHLIV